MINAITSLSISFLLLLSLTVPAAAGAPDTMPKRLVIAHDANYPPFSFVDERGVQRGYLIDLWKAFGNANSITIEFKLGTWQESLDMVKNGEADIHGGLFYSKERDTFLDYGPTIMDLSTDMYIKNDLTKTAARAFPVGVVKGGFEEHFMLSKRPDRSLTLFPQNRAMIEAAAKGSIKVFVADQPTGFHYMKRFEINDDFTSIETLYTMPMRTAVQEGDKQTLEVVEYGWTQVDDALRNHIYGKWFIPQDNMPGWVLPGALLSMLALIIAIIVRRAGRKAHGV